jgi:hypothetical protein
MFFILALNQSADNSKYGEFVLARHPKIKCLKLSDCNYHIIYIINSDSYKNKDLTNGGPLFDAKKHGIAGYFLKFLETI